MIVQKINDCVWLEFPEYDFAARVELDNPQPIIDELEMNSFVPECERLKAYKIIDKYRQQLAFDRYLEEDQRMEEQRRREGLIILVGCCVGMIFVMLWVVL